MIGLFTHRESKVPGSANQIAATRRFAETHWLIYAQVPGSVPFLDQFDFPAYAGNVMVPFEAAPAPRLEGPARTGTRTRLPLCRPRATFPEVI